MTSSPDQAQIKPLGKRRQRISTTLETQPDAVIDAQLFKYDGVLDAQGYYISNPEITVNAEGEGRVVVVNGAICAQHGCFYGQGPLTQEWLQDFYDSFTASYANREDCTHVTFD